MIVAWALFCSQFMREDVHNATVTRGLTLEKEQSLNAKYVERDSVYIAIRLTIEHTIRIGENQL